MGARRGCRVSRRAHRVELGVEDDYEVCGRVVVVGEVDVDVKAVVVLGVVGVDTGDVVVFDAYGDVFACCGLE